MRDRFQIWSRDAFQDRARRQREMAREGLLARAKLRSPAPIAANE
jgi:DNA-binding transcriptional regulator/RsmH inhibitor MraZ